MNHGLSAISVWRAIRNVLLVENLLMQEFESGNSTAIPIRTEQFGQIEASVLDSDAVVRTEYECSGIVPEIVPELVPGLGPIGRESRIAVIV
jgi:hypothetical protein